MNISLTPELEKVIQEKINSGMYNSPTEVIRESLKLLQERDILKANQLNELGNIDTKNTPSQSLWGVCADLGQAPSAEEIDAIRNEEWATFPREDI